MARFGKSDKRTSFGKQSRAEKSFHERKRTKPSSDSSFGGDERKSSKRSFSSSRSDRDDRSGGEGQFRRKPSGFGRSSEGPARKRNDRDFSDRKFSSGERREGRSTGRSSGSFEGKPFRKKFSRDEDRRSEDRDSSKPRFRRSDSSDEKFPRKNFSRKSSTSDDSSFRKRSFKREDNDRPNTFQKFDRSQVRKIKKDEDAQPEKMPSIPQKPSDGLIRLNKFMANSGVGSRREADEFIKMGLVTVNGVTITEMGHKVKPTDDVRYEGRKLKAEQPVYILLNKPKGFITTTDDPEERKTVMELVANACKERVYPVGRLDRNTTGLLLITNDGDLADKLTHPSYKAKKIYKVELNRALTKNDFQKILDGVYFEEGKAQVDDLAIVSDDGKEIGIEIHIGWNRIVRRIFEALGYEVVKLDRVAYAGLDKKELARGQWRFLKPEEVVRLKHFQE
ncbi:MAG: pseudouridine synthase [Bacteroidetes bacterium]|nr:pseudouridine synthase [Bacteroidota bacterium]MBS1539462.1 pseudouridine synthase [Bacteroidota bacterium]